MIIPGYLCTSLNLLDKAMENVKFDGCNVVYGEGQPQYVPLHAQKIGNVSITCYRLSLKERFKILFTGLLWLGQMNFGQPLQPQLPSLNKEDLIQD